MRTKQSVFILTAFLLATSVGAFADAFETLAQAQAAEQASCRAAVTSNYQMELSALQRALAQDQETAASFAAVVEAACNGVSTNTASASEACVNNTSVEAGFNATVNTDNEELNAFQSVYSAKLAACGSGSVSVSPVAATAQPTTTQPKSLQPQSFGYGRPLAAPVIPTLSATAADNSASPASELSPAANIDVKVDNPSDVGGGGKVASTALQVAPAAPTLKPAVDSSQNIKLVDIKPDLPAPPVEEKEKIAPLLR